MATLSPMMRQYFDIKDKYPGTLLFFRVGDFYEMFFDDAITASRELELTLTGKECGLEERAPMCGVPFHAVDSYIPRLVSRGYRVAICEQVEDPASAKGLVERDVVRIITPGTLTDAAAIGERRNNFLVAVCIAGRRAGISWCDLSTGEFFAQQIAADKGELRAHLAALAPGEILTNNPEFIQDCTSILCQMYPASAFQSQNAKEVLLSHFRTTTLLSLGLDQHHAAATCAAGALLHFLTETQKNGLEHIVSIRICEQNDTMPLDASTRRNLELTESLRGRSTKGSLLSVLDKTVTAMGGRLLRSWVENPLINKEKINARLRGVQALYSSPIAAEALRECLSKVYDLERLLGKISYHTLNARDCLSILRSLKQAPNILQLLEAVPDDAMNVVRALIDPCDELADLLERAINPDCPLLITEGDIIREGYNTELDELHAAARSGKQWLIDLEQNERDRTGIKNLRIQYNRVFGYYIEVTKSNYALVPLDYQRKQTLTNSERFTTTELRELESKLLGNQERAQKLEITLFDEIRNMIASQISRLQRTAEGYKTLDALISLAKVASENHYICPVITEEGILKIEEGRHPVVEDMLQDHSFVPNDTDMNTDTRRMHIITGPNMAGKSTYMRQVALIVLLAHMGSFVPAKSACIPLVDCVFTRVGASDDLASGQSTFMVEMSELSYILRNATNRSLVILDEIGRGTSTFDGLSIAWAAVEYLCDREKNGAMTLFATHYHELSELEGHLDGVVNSCIAVKEHGEEVIFLRKIIPGGADKSFGVYVARLAGVPRQVVARAQEIEARLEVNNINQNSIGQNILAAGKKKQKQQMDLIGFSQTEFIEEVRALDVLAMTPMDALNKLFLLKEKALKL